MKRRDFIRIGGTLAASLIWPRTAFANDLKVITVNGPIASHKMGNTLEHEHILVDFIGADQYDPSRWDREEVASQLLPYLKELKNLGCNTLIECTPAYLGRDVQLLKDLSQQSRLHIITNTGFYGARDNKYIPEFAFEASAQELADIWIREFEQGIDGTSVRPGFLKISVNPSPLSELHQKLVRAASITHLRTGLTIASHTGPALPAFEQLEILYQEGVHPSAFVWIHAQNEEDKSNYLKAAKIGAWISLDGLDETRLEEYIEMVYMMKKEGFLHKILISHDGGWYEPGKHWEGPIRKYTVLYRQFRPKLLEQGFSEEDTNLLFKNNPQKAFAIQIRKA